jgi:uncharacterized protein YecE (DUF72 family)
MNVTKEIRIGASGWHYRHWRGPFYPPETPPRKMFDYYLRFFDTVELNNTFYRLPDKSTMLGWRDAAPPGFRFAVKASRFITHMKKLKDPEPAIARFFDRIDTLGEKTGPILFQLPGAWPVDAARLEAFLAVLPPHYRYAFEFRNPTWTNDETLSALRRRNAAYCIFELAGYQTPLIATADFVYLRLHGPGGKYQGDYSSRVLERWACRIEAWSREGKDVWVYFDNDDSGFAPKNALELKAKVADYFSKTK